MSRQLPRAASPRPTAPWPWVDQQASILPCLAPNRPVLCVIARGPEVRPPKYGRRAREPPAPSVVSQFLAGRCRVVQRTVPGTCWQASSPGREGPNGGRSRLSLGPAYPNRAVSGLQPLQLFLSRMVYALCKGGQRVRTKEQRSPSHYFCLGVGALPGVITEAIKWGDAIFASVRLRPLRGHTP
jgi:hypothetical protein